jgi:hypothetical protein
MITGIVSVVLESFSKLDQSEESQDYFLSFLQCFASFTRFWEDDSTNLYDSGLPDLVCSWLIQIISDGVGQPLLACSMLSLFQNHPRLANLIACVDALYSSNLMTYHESGIYLMILDVLYEKWFDDSFNPNVIQALLGVFSKSAIQVLSVKTITEFICLLSPKEGRLSRFFRDGIRCFLRFVTGTPETLFVPKNLSFTKVALDLSNRFTFA